MKTRTKIFIGLQSIAIVVLCAVLLWPSLSKHKSKINRTPMESAAVSNVKLEVEDLATKIDKKGLSHLIMEDQVNVIQSTKQLDDTSKRIIDSLLVQNGLKDKQLSHYIGYSALLEGKLLKASKSDTGYYYKDPWAELQYIPGKDTTTHGHFNLKYNLELNYAEYSKKSNIFSKKKNYIDLWSSDPRATINGVKRVKIQPKQKAVIGVDAAALYIKNPYVGGEIYYQKDRLRASGAYLYNTDTENWYPAVKLNFRLLEF